MGQHALVLYGFSTWITWVSSHDGFKAKFLYDFFHTTGTLFTWPNSQASLSLSPCVLSNEVAGPLYMVDKGNKRAKTEAAKFLKIYAVKPRPTTSTVSLLLYLLFRDGFKASSDAKGEENRCYFLMEEWLEFVAIFNPL